MKRIFCLFFFLAMTVLISAGPVLADDMGVTDFGLKEQKLFKDECLLVAINCGSDFLSLEQKIDKLQKEIAKGRTVYSDDELRILKEQLNNAKKTQEFFRYEGASNWYKYPEE